MAEDPTVYEYDSIYDDMEDKKRQKDIKEANKKDKKVLYGNICWDYYRGMYCKLKAIYRIFSQQ